MRVDFYCENSGHSEAQWNDEQMSQNAECNQAIVFAEVFHFRKSVAGTAPSATLSFWDLCPVQRPHGQTTFSQSYLSHTNEMNDFVAKIPTMHSYLPGLAKRMMKDKKNEKDKTAYDFWRRQKKKQTNSLEFEGFKNVQGKKHFCLR